MPKGARKTNKKKRDNWSLLRALSLAWLGGKPALTEGGEFAGVYDPYSEATYQPGIFGVVEGFTRPYNVTVPDIARRAETIGAQMPPVLSPAWWRSKILGGRSYARQS